MAAALRIVHFIGIRSSPARLLIPHPSSNLRRRIPSVDSGLHLQRAPRSSQRENSDAMATGQQHGHLAGPLSDYSRWPHPAAHSTWMTASRSIADTGKIRGNFATEIPEQPIPSSTRNSTNLGIHADREFSDYAVPRSPPHLTQVMKPNRITLLNRSLNLPIPHQMFAAFDSTTRWFR